ncbi:MAG: SUMF1/EgtB/PvdO family nonheme iron enzyme [Alphaproteobacteria bacterium]|nr:SUMF1/EgtB/PvdO family nonheme iron enzyme [Alphaproteobacteria bacterium]
MPEDLRALLRDLHEDKLPLIARALGIDTTDLPGHAAGHGARVDALVDAVEGLFPDAPEAALRRALTDADVHAIGTSAKASAEIAARFHAAHVRAHKHLQVLGLHVGHGAKHLPLGDLFVEVELAHSSRGLKARGFDEALESQPTARTLSAALEAIAAARQARHARGVVLVGLPGSGKTTLLKKALLDAHEEEQRTPLLLRFSTLQRMGIDTLGPRSLHAWAEKEAQEAGHPGGGAALLEAPPLPLRFLLDGYDELRTREDRRAVAAWLAAEVERWPEADFVLTTRKAAWDEGDQRELLAHFEAYDLLHLTRAASEDLVQRWFPRVALARFDPGATKEEKADEEARANALGKRMLEEVLQTEDPAARARLRRLTGNPLMLSLLCLVFMEYEELPRNRGQLYAKCFEVLIRGSHRHAGARSAYTPEQGHQLLGPLAWAMQEGSEAPDSPKEMPEAEVLELLRAALDKVEETRGGEPAALLRELEQVCGLLVRLGEGQVAFMHLTFQEHLACEHAKLEGKAAELAVRAGEPRWREPILLGMSDARFREAFFETLLAQPGRLAANRELVRACRGEHEPPAGPFVELLQRGAPARGWVEQVGRWFRAAPEVEDLRLALELFRESAPEVLREAATALEGHEDETVRRLAAELRRGVIAVAGSLFVEALGIEFVEVPAGRFLIGASSEQGPGFDPDAFSDEGPPHLVELSKPFRIGRFPVTNVQYQRYVEATGVEAPSSFRMSGFDDPEMPVTGVSWHDAQAYCMWASRVAGATVRLPTEAEWECAARGREGFKYPWGDAPEPSLERAWYGGGSEHKEVVKGPAVVGGRPAGVSPFGAEDMAGNVWEWCVDTWRDNYGRVDALGIDPCHVDPAVSSRVLRGGSWVGWSWLLRCALRDGDLTENRCLSLGFRVVLVRPPEH